MDLSDLTLPGLELGYTHVHDVDVYHLLHKHNLLNTVKFILEYNPIDILSALSELWHLHHLYSANLVVYIVHDYRLRNRLIVLHSAQKFSAALPIVYQHDESL